MGRTAIPHIVLAIAAIVAATVLFALGHTDPGYALLGVAGVGGVAGAAVTIPAGAPGTTDPIPLGPIMRAAAAALGGGDTSSSQVAATTTPPAAGATPVPPAAADIAPPPPAVTP